jgi:hypothetical protein
MNNCHYCENLARYKCPIARSYNSPWEWLYVCNKHKHGYHSLERLHLSIWELLGVAE